MPLYTSTGAFNVAVNDTTGTGRYSASGALRINLVSGASYVGLYAADGAMNVVDVTGVSISTYGGLYHPSGAIRGRTAPTTLSGLQAPDGSYYFLGLFSPLNLFSAGEQGAWYDPSDFSTMFQDSAGTTPVTAVEQPVGLILDKSKGLALGSELVSNGDFSNGTTGWSPANANITIAVVGGVGEMTSSVSNIYVAQTVNVTSGKTYIVTGQGRAGTAPLLPLVVSGGVVLGTQINSSASLQPISFIFVAGAATASLRFQVQSGSGGTAYFDNISVKELPGNHASQATSASRPVLSARVNLLTYTETIGGTNWAGAGGPTVQLNNAVAPNGTTTATRISDAVDIAVVQQTVTMPSGATYTASVSVKQAASLTGFSIYENSGNGVSVDLSTRTVTNVGTVLSSSVTSEDNGFYRVSYTAAVVNTTFVLRMGHTSAFDVYVWGADLRVTNDGVGIPAYQRVAAATDYDTSGFPLYLRFDGTDDSLATASIDFSATDKMSVFAGVRKLSDTAAGVVTELSSNINSNNGAFIFAPGSYTTATGSLYHASSKGTVIAPLNSTTTFASPITNVISALFDIAGDKNTIRINGLQNAQSTDDQGTGNYGNYPLYIGRRGGTSLPYNGRLYSLIVRGAQSTDAQIASTETWVNGKTGAY